MTAWLVSGRCASPTIAPLGWSLSEASAVTVLPRYIRKDRGLSNKNNNKYIIVVVVVVVAVVVVVVLMSTCIRSDIIRSEASAVTVMLFSNPAEIHYMSVTLALFGDV